MKEDNFTAAADMALKRWAAKIIHDLSIGLTYPSVTPAFRLTVRSPPPPTEEETDTDFIATNEVYKHSLIDMEQLIVRTWYIDYRDSQGKKGSMKMAASSIEIPYMSFRNRLHMAQIKVQAGLTMYWRSIEQVPDEEP